MNQITTRQRSIIFTAAHVARRIRSEAAMNNEQPEDATRENVRRAIEDIPASGSVRVVGQPARWINDVARSVENTFSVRRGTWS